MNDIIGNLLGLNAGDNQPQHILDAGCGIGGTIIHLAKKYPHVTFKGITLLAEHIELAKRLAEKNQVSDNVEFLVADFLKTGFSSNQFDAIYLIESACYASIKHVLLHELYRILKPGGTLLFIDCFRTPVQLNQALMTFYIWFCKSWGLPNLIILDEFQNLLKTKGFRDLITRDFTKNIIRSIAREDIVSFPFLFSILFHRLIQGKFYRVETDSNFLAAAAPCSTLLGLKKAITYNAITVIK